MYKAVSAKIACSFLIAIWGYTFWPSLQNMVQSYWISGYDYQGLIALPLVLILTLSKTYELNRSVMTYNPYGLLALLATSVLWLFAVITKLVMLQQFALISMLIPIVLTTCGAKITKIIALPLSCFFLLLPFGQQLYANLQQAFSWLLLEALSLSNQSVYWQNNLIYVGNQEYTIADILSSLRYATLYLAFGATYAFFITNSLRKRIVIVCCSIMLPFMMLLVATYGIINVRTWLNLNTIASSDCIIISWGLAAIGLISCMLFGFVIRQASSLHGGSDNIDWHNDYGYKTQNLVPSIMASVIILILPTVAQNLKEQAHYASTEYASTNLEPVVNWQGPVAGKYNKGKQNVTMSVINNNTQYNSIEQKTDWQQIKTSTLTIKLPNKNIPVTETILKKNRQTQMIWSLDYVNGHLTTNAMLNQILRNLYTLSKHGTEAKLIEISSNVDSDLNSGRLRLKNFLQDLQQAPASSWLR